jgi:thioredoxin 1
MLKDFKDSDFEEKIKQEEVSVIQFSATWCGPCKALKPVMDKLSEEYKDKISFWITDIEDSGINTGSAAGIRGVPTLILYKKGIEVARKVGGVPESHVKTWLNENL